MIALDSQVTPVDLSGDATTTEVARGTSVTDASGTRQATLMFAPGTQGSLVMPDGSTRPLTQAHVRATEYTVGPSGPAAMPADLPPTSGYTYAVDLSLDEEATSGASSVSFNKPVSFYVEDFLKFPAGTVVPAGYYDPARGAWVPSDNGVVVKILSVTNHMADLDIDGSGTPASADALAAAGITDAERQQLASTYRSARACGACRSPTSQAGMRTRPTTRPMTLDYRKSLCRRPRMSRMTVTMVARSSGARTRRSARLWASSVHRFSSSTNPIAFPAGTSIAPSRSR